MLTGRPRASQAARIKANQNPDGSPYEARKPQEFLGRKRKGRIRKTMFGKLIRTRWLKGKGSASEATVNFVGAATRIANVHQFGLIDRVEHNSHSPRVKYAKRELLGFSEHEITLIEHSLLEHFGSI